MNTFKMHPHVFLLLLSSGVSSYFLPQKEMPPHLLNKTKNSAIDEMLCLLQAENKSIMKSLFIPSSIKNLNCAHNSTEIFIEELQKIDTLKCMKVVEKDMKMLEKSCPILKKSSSNDEGCSKIKTKFPRFKKELQEFLRWVNQELDCSSAGRGEASLYLASKCSCHDSWKPL